MVKRAYILRQISADGIFERTNVDPQRTIDPYFVFGPTALFSHDWMLLSLKSSQNHYAPLPCVLDLLSIQGMEASSVRTKNKQQNVDSNLAIVHLTSTATMNMIKMQIMRAQIGI